MPAHAFAADIDALFESAWQTLGQRPFSRGTHRNALPLFADSPQGQTRPYTLGEAEQDRDLAARYNLEGWQAYALRKRVESLPARLSAAVAQSLEDGSTTPQHAMVAGEIIGRHGRLMRLAGIDIQANNQTIHAGSEAMADHGRRHRTDAARWLEWLNVQIPKRNAHKRIADEEWWRRTLRSVIRQARETAWLHGSPSGLQWCSEDGIQERQTVDATNDAWAARRELVSDTGVRLDAPTRRDSDMKQRAELLAITHGIRALSHSRRAALVTLTAPSRFHRMRWNKTKAAFEKNPRWDGSSPADAFQYLQKQWTRARAALKRAGVGQHWIMGVQPHKDETPHPHVVFFEDDLEQLEAVLMRYFRDQERERGDGHRVDVRELEGGAMGGVKYVSRAILYVSRAAEHTEGEAEAGAEALATKQWASTWGIRRLRSSHTRKTAWRLARRPDVLPEGHQVREAARENDYAEFVRAYALHAGKLMRAPDLNKYGERVKRVIGLSMGGVDYEKTTHWQSIERGSNAHQNSALRGGARTVIAKYQGARARADDQDQTAQDTAMDENTRAWRRAGQMLGDPLSFLFLDEVAEGPPPPPAPGSAPTRTEQQAANDGPTSKPWVRSDGSSFSRAGKQWADLTTGEIVGLDQPQPEPQHTPAPTPDAARAAWWRAVRDLGVWNEDGTPAVPSGARLST